MQTRLPNRLLATSRAAQQGVPSLLEEPRLVVLRQYDRIGSIKQGSIDLGYLQHGLNMICLERFLTACYHRDPALTIWSLRSPSTIRVFCNNLPPSAVTALHNLTFGRYCLPAYV